MSRQELVTCRFCSMCGYRPECLFDRLGAGTCWRGDGYEGQCKLCKAAGEPVGGVVYGLLLRGRLVYVGSTRAPVEVRHERAWLEAFGPETCSYRMPLSRALREFPDRADWAVVTLQEVSPCSAGLLEGHETAWMMKSAAPGEARPLLNRQFAKVRGMWAFRDLGDRVALDLANVPRVSYYMFNKLAKSDPEALKRLFRLTTV